MAAQREVEAKYRLRDPDRFVAALSRLGFVEVRTERHRDRYFRHPCRDFAATDEALRLRIDQTAGTSVLTYKGPRSDGPVKSREEIELPVPESIATLVERLGFVAVSDVRKTRVEYRAEGPTTATVDRVDGVGAYAEIECVVPAGGDEAAATQTVLQTAAALGLDDRDREPRSYLELVLERAGSRSE